MHLPQPAIANYVVALQASAKQCTAAMTLSRPEKHQQQKTQKKSIPHVTPVERMSLSTHLRAEPGARDLLQTGDPEKRHGARYPSQR